MSDRKLQFDSSNLPYEDAATIAEREIRQNSPFDVEEILKDQPNKTAFTSSSNAVSVAEVGNSIVVDLNGTQQVMDAIEEALNTQASGGSPARSGTGPTNPDLGGTGPDNMEFDETNPPSMPQPGEDIEESKDWYLIVERDFNTRVEPEEQDGPPMVPRDEVLKGPYDTEISARQEGMRVTGEYQSRNATAIKDTLTERFWVHANDDEVLVEVMTDNGERGKAQMPEGLAKEAEYLGWAAIVQDTVPDDTSLPPQRQPDYIRPRYIEDWNTIFNNLQEYTAEEPTVPSPMDDNTVPQSQADRESRVEMARREDPQATADIYENGVVSLNRQGSVDTIDTSIGVFISRSDNTVAMGYMGDDLNMTQDQIDTIVSNIRTFLESNNG